MSVVIFILIFLVFLLFGICMYLYNRINFLDTAFSVLQFHKGVDVVGDIESNRQLLQECVRNVVECKDTVFR